MRGAPWWVVAIISGVYFGGVMGTFYYLTEHRGWRTASIAGAVAGILFGLWMGVTTTARRNRLRSIAGPIDEERIWEAYRSADKGPVPTDPEIRRAASRIIQYRLHRLSQMKTSGYLVSGLFIVLGLYLVITSGPGWWISVAVFVSFLILTRWQSIRIRKQAALFGIDPNQPTPTGGPEHGGLGMGFGDLLSDSGGLLTLVIRFRWWALSLGLIMAALAVARTVTAHGNHGIGEAVLTVILWGCALWGFIGRSRMSRNGSGSKVEAAGSG
jgi:hypothetical protein